MFGLGFSELLILGLLVLVLFGAKKLPAFGSALAEGIRNFQKGLHGTEKKTNNSTENDSN